jgi:hypothetical protein
MKINKRMRCDMRLIAYIRVNVRKTAFGWIFIYKTVISAVTVHARTQTVNTPSDLHLSLGFTNRNHDA